MLLYGAENRCRKQVFSLRGIPACMSFVSTLYLEHVPNICRKVYLNNIYKTHKHMYSFRN